MEKQLLGLGIVLAILAFGLLTLIVDLRRGRRQHRTAMLSQENHDSDSANRPGRSARAPRARG
jgi:hypothetical protein